MLIISVNIVMFGIGTNAKYAYSHKIKLVITANQLMQNLQKIRVNGRGYTYP